MVDVTVFHTFSQVEHPSPWASSPVFFTATCSLIVLGTLYAYLFSANDTNKMHQLGGLSIVNASIFFNKRYEFLRSNRFKTGCDLFSFKIFQYQVVALSGDEARKAFYSMDLDIDQGHMLLRGVVPKLKDIKAMDDNSNITALNKRLLRILRRDRLQDFVPTMLSDLNRLIETWGTAGKMDPFTKIYDLIFQLTIRMGTCSELATDARSIQKIQDFYWMFEKSITPVGLLLPWFPGTAKKNKDQSIKGLYNILLHYVDVRRKSNVRTSDAIDVLIADGEDDATIVELTLVIIFGGVANTAMITCWILFFLGSNTEWKDEVISEVRNLLATTNPSEPIVQRISTIPISTWEDEVPVIENVIRETVRLIRDGPSLRRNIRDDIQVAGKTIDKGAFVVYNMEDVHLNEKIYSEPFKFDPGRFSAPREEDKQGHLLFLGWGAGRHPCSGMRFAKLEIKMILTLFLSRYEYTLVDESGNVLKQQPQPNRNDILQSKPIGEQCFIQYKKIKE